jgi:hypothetical protein
VVLCRQSALDGGVGDALRFVVDVDNPLAHHRAIAERRTRMLPSTIVAARRLVSAQSVLIGVGPAADRRDLPPRAPTPIARAGLRARHDRREASWRVAVDR